MSEGPLLLVRSYRRVFRLERRIYRVDRFSVPVPGGISLRGLLAFLVSLLAMLALGRMPFAASVLALVPLPLRFLVLPGAVGLLATQVAPDGRPLHRFLVAWLSFRLRRPVADGVATRICVPYAPDLDDPRLRRARIVGPARVDVRVSVRLCGGRRGLSVRGCDLGSRLQPFRLGPRERLEVRA